MSAEKSKVLKFIAPTKRGASGGFAKRSEAKEKRRFETEVFSNGYKIFQFLKQSILSKGKS